MSVTPRWLGRMEFAAALELQLEIAHAHEQCGDTLLLLEHDPVFTTGRRGAETNLPPANATEVSKIPVHRIARGGDVTFHGPGQLVGYALIDLRARGHDVHRFLRALEAGVISLLAALDVAGERCAGRTGVWVSRDGRLRKIASIGIGVRRGISMHGFALNVSNDLEPFRAIVPCGLADVEMTSVAQELSAPAPSVAQVAELAARHVCQALEPAEAA